MAKPSMPFSRNMQAARARQAKAMLLPLPRTSSEAFALRAHITLDVLRRGRGSLYGLQMLADVMTLVALIADLGYGTVATEDLRAAEAAIAGCAERGHETGEWRLDPIDAECYAPIVMAYDRQLQKAPVWALTAANEQLERLRAESARREPKI